MTVAAAEKKNTAETNEESVENTQAVENTKVFEIQIPVQTEKMEVISADAIVTEHIAKEAEETENSEKEATKEKEVTKAEKESKESKEKKESKESKESKKKKESKESKKQKETKQKKQKKTGKKKHTQKKRGAVKAQKKKVYYSNADLRMMSAIIYCEAGAESYAGKLGVGIVIMNRKASSSFPNSVRGVVYERGQFSPSWNGTLSRALARYDAGHFNSANERACVKAAKEVLSGRRNVVVHGREYNMRSFHFFSRYVSGARLSIGGHQFK